MPMKNISYGEVQNMESVRLLNEYRAILQNNDHMISGLEVMQKIPEPTISQRARMKELEEQLIPDGIRKEKDLGARIRPLVASLQGEGTPKEMKMRALIELRYFNQLSWEQVAEALFFDRWEEATKSQRLQYLRQTYRLRNHALKELDEILRAGDR